MGPFDPTGDHTSAGTIMVSFKGARFVRDIILTCGRWYLAYPLSYRQVAELMEARGVSVDHATNRVNSPHIVSTRKFATEPGLTKPGVVKLMVRAAQQGGRVGR